MQKLSDSFKWKYHGKIENTQTLDLPEDFNELNIYLVDIYQEFPYAYNFYIQKEIIDTYPHMALVNGQGAAYGTSSITTNVIIENNKLSLLYYADSGNYINRVIAYVYYR